MCVICLCAGRIGLGWAHDVFLFCMSHVHVFPMHTYSLFIYLIYLNYLGLFWLFFSSSPLLPLNLFTLVVSMIPKHKSTPARNPLHFDASSSTDPSFLLSGSAMMMPLMHFQRTSPDEAFIRNAKSFYQTLPTLTFPLSFTVGDGSHCVTSRSHVLSCLSRSFTPTCMGLIVQYLSFSLAFEVRAFMSHHRWLRMCFVSLG